MLEMDSIKQNEEKGKKNNEDSDKIDSETETQTEAESCNTQDKFLLYHLYFTLNHVISPVNC